MDGRKQQIGQHRNGRIEGHCGPEPSRPQLYERSSKGAAIAIAEGSEDGIYLCTVIYQIEESMWSRPDRLGGGKFRNG